MILAPVEICIIAEFVRSLAKFAIYSIVYNREESPSKPSSVAFGFNCVVEVATVTKRRVVTPSRQPSLRSVALLV